MSAMQTAGNEDRPEIVATLESPKDMNPRLRQILEEIAPLRAALCVRLVKVDGEATYWGTVMKLVSKMKGFEPGPDTHWKIQCDFLVPDWRAPSRTKGCSGRPEWLSFFEERSLEKENGQCDELKENDVRVESSWYLLVFHGSGSPPVVLVRVPGNWEPPTRANVRPSCRRCQVAFIRGSGVSDEPCVFHSGTILKDPLADNCQESINEREVMRVYASPASSSMTQHDLSSVSEDGDIDDAETESDDDIFWGPGTRWSCCGRSPDSLGCAAEVAHVFDDYTRGLQ